jgi:hypothetical protein
MTGYSGEGIGGLMLTTSLPMTDGGDVCDDEHPTRRNTNSNQNNIRFIISIIYSQ